VPEWQDVSVVNDLGDFGIAMDRLAFIDGAYCSPFPSVCCSPCLRAEAQFSYVLFRSG